MKAAPKTPKAKRQEEQANFISWRFALLCGCILLALAFLLGRVAWLQVISPDMLVRQGDMRSLRVQEVSTARGMITDRSGRPLAVSVPVKAIWADPKELHDAGGVTLDTAGRRWPMRSICRWISWHRASIPIRGCVLSIWRVRLTLIWPTTSKN
jgi:cell division protein FtsI (penicillin-binding protein 3)